MSLLGGLLGKRLPQRRVDNRNRLAMANVNVDERGRGNDDDVDDDVDVFDDRFDGLTPENFPPDASVGYFSIYHNVST